MRGANRDSFLGKEWFGVNGPARLVRRYRSRDRPVPHRRMSGFEKAALSVRNRRYRLMICVFDGVCFSFP